MAGHGKRYQDAAKLVDRNRLYPIEEAVALARETSNLKFDASVEAHLRLGVDPRHADQMVRGTVVLPHGTGKVVRVAVFAQGEKAQEALRAGADEVGAEDLVKKIEAGWLEFDVALATPDIDGPGRPARPDPRPPRPDAEPQVGHDHVRPRPRHPRGQGRAASSSRSTRARSSTSRSARRASSRRSWPRTWPAWSTPSTAPSPPAPRASTCGRSRSRRRWAPASASTSRRLAAAQARGIAAQVAASRRAHPQRRTSRTSARRRSDGPDQRNMTRRIAADSLRPQDARPRREARMTPGA